MNTFAKRKRILQRNQLLAAMRQALQGLDYDEVETPLLVPSPGMEPAIQAFRSQFIPETGNPAARPLWLHTSPEYAMKRMLADGWQRIFQFCKVFRNGEAATLHNPEFTMLELYRVGVDYRQIMDDLEKSVLAGARALGHGDSFTWQGHKVRLNEPFERLSVREAMLRHTGMDILELEDPEEFRDVAREKGYFVSASATSWDDVFFSVFLSAVEPRLGFERPTYLIDYPASMAALARLKPEDPRFAERFELYAAGVELANGYSELTDPKEQRRRLVLEQQEREKAGSEVYPLDEFFLDAVGKMPECGGVALGVDRLAMLLTDASELAEVLLFPAIHEWGGRD